MTATETAGGLVTVTRADPHALDLLHSLGRPASLVTAGGWHVVVGAPLRAVTDLDDLDRVAESIGWRDGSPAPARWGGDAPHTAPGSSGAPAALPPFTGGLVGALSDDLSTRLLELAPDSRRGWHGPAVDLALHDTAACRAPDGRWHLVAAELPDSREPAEPRLARLADALAAAERLGGTRRRSVPHAVAAASLSRDAHARAVERTLAWIAAGDLYQLNLTLQLTVRWNGDGLGLARRLAETEPAPAHGAVLLGADGRDVVSVSPETFLRVDGDAARMRPIKGTRPRAGDPHADQRLAHDLREAAKDHAEHVMIVDLVRNDLGRVCRTGSVRVPRLAELEGLPTVWHLTSDVVGRLRADVRLSELLAATFPCGSVTGAPKRMATRRIRVLEPVPRGIYCGAIGVVSRGLVDLSVAIRTATVADGFATWGTGGGVVADSTPDGEWDEAMAKATAFFAATGAAAPS